MTIKQFNDEGILCSNHARKDQYINPLTWLHDSSVLHTPLHATISLPHTEKGVEINLSLYYFGMYYAFIRQAIIYHLTFDDVLSALGDTKSLSMVNNYHADFRTVSLHQSNNAVIKLVYYLHNANNTTSTRSNIFTGARM